VNDYGLDGLDNLYAGIRKGVPGLQFILTHPGFMVMPFNVFPDYAGLLRQSQVMPHWKTLLLKSRFQAELVRYLLLSVITTLVILVVVPGLYLAQAFPLLLGFKGGTERNYVKITVQILVIVTFFFMLLLAAQWVAGGSLTPGAPPAAKMVSVSGGRAGSAAPDGAAFAFNAVSLLALLLILFIQFGAYARAMNELQKVKDHPGSVSLKLKQLDNVDIFFDLPLYLGLLGTVTSFVIMLFDPGVSRIVAYSSTIVGIIFSALIRVIYQYPLRKELLNMVETEPARRPE
jgi:hypothetical protein